MHALTHEVPSTKVLVHESTHYCDCLSIAVQDGWMLRLSCCCPKKSVPGKGKT